MKDFDISVALAIEQNEIRQREAYRQQKLQEVKTLLSSYFQGKPVTEVYLIGSLLRPHGFNQYSDIDIVVKGMPPEAYFQIFGELEDLLHTEHLDLIEMERCHFGDLIERSGERIL